MADKKQIHRVELVVELDDAKVGELVDQIYDITLYTKGLRIVSSDTTPLDIEQVENAWIKDIINIDKLNKHIKKNQVDIEQVESLQNHTHSPSNWTEYEETLVDLREKLEKLETWHNQVNNSKET